MFSFFFVDCCLFWYLLCVTPLVANVVYLLYIFRSRHDWLMVTKLGKMSVWSALSHCIFRIHIFIGWFNFNAATDYRTKRKALNNSYYFSYIVYFTQLFVLCELSIMVFCHEYHYYSSLLKFCLWRAQNRHATNRWSLQQISKYSIQRAFRTVPKGPKPLLKIFWVGVFIVDHLFGLSIDVIKYMTRLYPKKTYNVTMLL